MSELVSQREFAKHIGRSHVWVNKLVKEGRLPANDRGRIPLSEGLEAYGFAQQPGDDTRRAVAAEQRKEHKAKAKAKTKTESVADLPEPGGGGMSVAQINEAYNRARLAEKTYQAKMRELEFREASGELIPAPDVENDAVKTGAEVREKLLTVPPRVAGLCEGKPAREIERILDEAINEALEALQRARFGKR